MIISSDTIQETIVMNLKSPEGRQMEGREYAVYCGRISNTQHHFGNPASHSHRGLLASVIVKTREESVKFHDEWLDGKHPNVEPHRLKWVLHNMSKLKGKILLCFCAPKSCHCDNYKRRVDAL